MQVNGKPENGGIGMILAEYVREKGYREDRIAVERNGVLVPRSQYGETRLQPEDVLEIVSFVGGG